MLDGIAAISLCRMLAGPSTIGQSTPSRECIMRLFVGNLMRGPLRATTPDVNTLGLEESDQALLPQFVQTAKQNVGPSSSLFVCLGNLQNDRTSIPCCLLEVREVHDSSPRPLPLRRIVLPLVGQSWGQSRSTSWMELNLSTHAYETFGSPDLLILTTAGSIPESREMVVTSCRRTIVPTSLPSYRRSEP
jgi:hypothetical protein